MTLGQLMTFPPEFYLILILQEAFSEVSKLHLHDGIWNTLRNTPWPLNP